MNPSLPIAKPAIFSILIRTFLAAIALSSFTSVVALSGGCMAIEDSELDAKAIEKPFLAVPIEPPVFYESNQDGEVINGPVADILSDEDVFKNAGSRPIHVQKYGPFGNGGTLSTGFPTSDWIAVVVGMDTTDGDINEVGTGNPLRAFPFQSNGIWHITFDLRSHRDNESWSIWVMYIQRSMATSAGF